MPKKRKKIPTIQVSSVPNQLRKAREYPIRECFITENWQDRGMCSIFIIREKTGSSFILGVYLIDTFCLGLKNTFYKTDISYAEITDMIRNKQNENMIEVESEYAHAVIYGAIEYAENLGFAPQSDFKYTKFILQRREEVNLNCGIEFGKDGMPFYIAGPLDSREKINRIILHLDKKVGKDNYHFATPG